MQVARGADGGRRIVAVAEVVEGAGSSERASRTDLVADAGGVVAQ